MSNGEDDYRSSANVITPGQHGNGIERTLGMLVAKSDAIDRRLDAHSRSATARMDLYEKNQEDILLMLAQGKGMWKALTITGVIGALLGAVGTKFSALIAAAFR